jgi:hypothetical protein
MIHSGYRAIAPYTTRDGSTIRKRKHPDTHGNRARRLAAAGRAPGARTRWHRVINAGAEDPVFPCGCSLAYAHADTGPQAPRRGGDG